MGVPRYSMVRDAMTDAGGLRLNLAGEIDLAAHDTLLAAILTAINDATTRLVIDLDQVTFVDSGGIGVLVYGLREANAAGCGYQVANAHGIVREVLEITGVFSALTGDDNSSRLDKCPTAPLVS